jgi:GT2 family glycosyltransferase
MRASIVIPVYNQVFYTRVCLSALEDQATDSEVIVVDNASSDSTSHVLAGWVGKGSGRHVIRNDENLGFACACNAGAAKATTEFLVFLNNDTFVLPGWLDNLLEPFADPTITVTGSRLLYPNGHIQHAGVAFDEDGPRHIFVGLPGDMPAALERRDYQAVTGASLAIRASEFHRLSGFDTAFHNTYEDVDLCLRVRHSGGRVVYVPSSVAYHFESMTEGRVGTFEGRNHELLMQRWSGRFDRDGLRLEHEAVERGIDLNADRVPSRRDAIQSEAELTRLTEALADANTRAAAAEAKLNHVMMELDELRTIRRMRSVRAALRARGAFRRIVPAPNTAGMMPPRTDHPT